MTFKATASKLTLIFSALVSVAAASPTRGAEANCLEGRTLAGECVEPDLAWDARKSAVLYAIPKLSYTSPPLMPSQERGYYRGLDHHTLNSLYWQPYVSPGTGGFFRIRP